MQAEEVVKQLKDFTAKFFGYHHRVIQGWGRLSQLEALKEFRELPLEKQLASKSEAFADSIGVASDMRSFVASLRQRYPWTEVSDLIEALDSLIEEYGNLYNEERYLSVDAEYREQVAVTANSFYIGLAKLG